MSARGTVGGVVASAAIIVIAWQVGQSTATASPSASGTGSVGSSSSTTTTTPSTSTPSTSTPGTSTTPSASTGASTGTTTTSVNGSFAGDSVSTRFGNMQVEIVVADGKITQVKVLQATDREQRSVQISSYADPILTSEVIKAQSANVQMVSGATYTSDGYLQSLQSALDKAGL